MLKVLIKTRLQSLFSSMFGRMLRRRKSGRRGAAMKVLLGLFAVYVVAALSVSVGLYFAMMAGPFAQLDLGWLYFAMAGMAAAVLCFVGSVFITQSQLFYARDNALLLSMPIPPGYILASRMLTLLILNYIYTLLIMGPAIAVWVVKIGLSGPMAAVSLALATLALPLISLSASCLCGWVIGLVTSRLRRSNLATVGLFFLFFGGYMYVMINLQVYLGRLVANGAAIGEAVRRAVPPAYWFGRAAMGDGGALGLFLLCALVPFAAACWLIARSFITILTTKKGAVRIQYKARAMTVRRPFAALLMRELGRFFGTPIYVFNAGVGAVMHIALAVMLVWKGPGALTAMLGTMPEATDLAPALICAAISFCSSMVMPSAVSVSLEGRNLWIVKSAPVSTGQIFASKVAVNLVVALPSGLAASLACLWLVPMSAAMAVAVLLIPAACTLMIALLGLAANLLMPRLDWVSEAVVVKQSASVLVTLFGSMAILALPILLYAFWLAPLIALDGYLLICLAVILALCAGLYAFLRGRGRRLFEAL